MPPTHNPSRFPPYSHFRGKHACCGAVTEKDWLHREGLAAQWLNHPCAICQRLAVTHSNTGSSSALPRRAHTATPGLLLLYPASHTQQHRVFFCFTPPVTHSNTGSSALPRQAHTAKPGLLLYPARHTQQHRVVFCFTPPVTHSNTGSSALPRQSHTATPGLLLYPASHTQQHRVFCFTPPGTDRKGYYCWPHAFVCLLVSNCICPSKRSRTKITRTLCARPRQCVYTEDRRRGKGDNTACAFWTSL